MSDLINARDAALRARAEKVVPSGMWGHLHAVKLPEAYPQFFARGEGGVVWDVDGNRYVDFMCSWGPNLLGHHHPEVEEAAERQRRLGDCLNGPGEVMVELAEMLVDTIAHADWALFQKNGTDATTTCVTVARAATAKRKVLVAKGAYHGAVPWCSPSLVGVTAEDRAHLIYYIFNDIESLENAVKEAGDDMAAIVVSAYRHDLGFDQELPTEDFAKAARRLADSKNAALILDEVRAGFRLYTAGSWEPLGVRPDLSAWSKAIANGYALSAVTGSDWLRKAASQVFVTGSFWAGAVAMAAALATLKVVRRDDVPAKVSYLGQMLRDGLETRSRQFGVSIRQSGPAQMPTVLFDDDADFAKGSAFCRAALAKGVYFHPKHNMFLCASHTEADIAEALVAAEHGFAAVSASGDSS
ncbi:aminotransferase class III-fold pyridoxal phosphate-dependent enzyme [Neorhizobium sp. Rsf11]|uniref:Aminotransferase class III-fold pyridoxal phosphate-dependent enzyme n=2 Tax=Neorhizobium TaxID=1525371 RepID=A0ABV0LZE0_9HYPH|nr:aminotransferase class III-fold pyridoxal phosphate-dependent enzyme [Neorhizobium petrolearium]MCC2611179.1 aminotransferase class III-fold pyridoxal phosphate-dependent enzyme [Neorhizobium petrolearium]WGI66387.1 aminotransferase class III-fold pyridoxal phosphate-dependent enzyme [Neorhizobium petrolearium]